MTPGLQKDNPRKPEPINRFPIFAQYWHHRNDISTPEQKIIGSCYISCLYRDMKNYSPALSSFPCDFLVFARLFFI
jgi:hypothetical protein